MGLKAMSFLRSFFRILARNIMFLGGGRGPTPDESNMTISVVRLPDAPEDRGGGVREPRHPKPSGWSGAEALPLPNCDEDA
jgi:hypothetical protein